MDILYRCRNRVSFFVIPFATFLEMNASLQCLTLVTHILRHCTETLISRNFTKGMMTQRRLVCGIDTIFPQLQRSVWFWLDFVWVIAVSHLSAALLNLDAGSLGFFTLLLPAGNRAVAGAGRMYIRPSTREQRQQSRRANRWVVGIVDRQVAQS